MGRDEILASLREFKKTHGDEYDITRIGIFGSFARGEEREDSDIDIVFETNSPNLFKTSRMRQELEEFLGRHVDVIRLRDTMNLRLRKRIMQEALYA